MTSFDSEKNAVLHSYLIADYFDLDSFEFNIECGLSYANVRDDGLTVFSNESASDELIDTEPPDIVSIETTFAVRKRKHLENLLPRPAKAKSYQYLDPKLITFFSAFISLYNASDIESLIELFDDICDPDIQVVYDTPGTVLEYVGVQCMYDRWNDIFTSCPDGVRVDSNLQLQEDAYGLFLSRDFKFTGTRIMKSDLDKEIIGDGTIQIPIGQALDSSILSNKQIVQQLMKDDDKSPNPKKGMAISISGMYRFYVNMDTRKTFRKMYSQSLWEIPLKSGQLMSFLPLMKIPVDIIVCSSDS